MAAVPIFGNEKIIISIVDNFFTTLKLLILSELDCSSLNFKASQ